MKYKVRFTSDAEEDLKEIFRFIAEDNIAAAKGVIQKIRQQASQLSEHPHLGAPREDIRKNLRIYPVSNYNIFYDVQAPYIIVARILHAARDVDRQF